MTGCFVLEINCIMVPEKEEKGTHFLSIFQYSNTFEQENIESQSSEKACATTTKGESCVLKNGVQN